MENKTVILCIDDEPIILASLVEQLERYFGQEYLYEEAESAEEAFEIIEDFEDDEIDIDVIVCDWLMPGMKGDEFLLKMDLKYPRTAKVLLTGQADEQSVFKLRQEADKFAIVHKPWDKEELINAIKSQLNNE